MVVIKVISNILFSLFSIIGFVTVFLFVGRLYGLDWISFVLPSSLCSAASRVAVTTVPASPSVDIDRLAEKITARLPSICPDISKCAVVADDVVAASARLSAIATTLSDRPSLETPACGCCGSPHETTRVEAPRAASDREYCPAISPCSPLDSASKFKACLNELEDIGKHYQTLSDRARSLHNEGQKAIDVRPY